MNHATLQRALQDAQSGKLDAAIASVRSLLRIQPKNTDALQLLGLFLTQAGQSQQAVVQLERAVSLAPQVAGYRNNLGNALAGIGRQRDAAAQYEKAVALDPAYFRAYLGLALARTAMLDAPGAVEACRRGLAIRPDWPEMVSCAATAFEAADRIDEAIRCVRDAVRRDPSSELLRSKLAFLLNYAAATPAEAFAAHREYHDLVARTPQAPPRPVADPERPLRIGVLSGDLRTHSVGYFAEPIFRTKHAGDAIVVFATLPGSDRDAMTTRFRALADGWVESSILDHASLDAAIRRERIDVLLELSGHTNGGRLAALDRKPAPVIVSAIGYPNTTGHPCVDWRVVDATTDPAGSEAYATERLLRLDPCFLCYEPPVDAPAPTLPAEDAPITFGSFNLTSKVGPDTIRFWRAALEAVPGSRLLVKSKSIADDATRRSVLARLEAGGIDPSRVETLAYTATQADHFALYGRMHVALDTHPYNGTTTTCEALWMGVPVVTLEGDRHAARVGASLLRAAGCEAWIARSPEEFAACAARLAADRSGLAEFRRTARERLRASVLLDSAAYGARFHDALRATWRDWCGRNAGQA
jgi:protein O-GlcNAc transferase